MSDYCLATQDKSILRCNKRQTTTHGYCARHNVLDHWIQHYDGSIYNEKKELVKHHDKVWIFINENKNVPLLREIASLMKRGSCVMVTRAFLENNLFSQEKDLRKMYPLRNKIITASHLEQARAFLGTFFYFKNHPPLLLQAVWRGYLTRKRLGMNPQRISRIVYMKRHIGDIKKIQRWIRHKLWRRSFVVPPDEFRKRFLTNEKNICKIQRQIKKYLSVRKSRSLPCPYSFQEPEEIPQKYRIIYKDTLLGSKPHWRYYDLRCLNKDFDVQIQQRLTLREPSTRRDFPKEFVVYATERIWKMTRDLTEPSLPEVAVYNGEFERRSLYGYLTCVLDVLWIVRYFKSWNDVHIPSWAIVRNKEKIQHLYLRLIPILSRLARNCSYYELEEKLLFSCQRFLSVRMVMSLNNEDELAGELWCVCMKVLKDTSSHPPLQKLFVDAIRNNVIDVLE